MSKKFVLNLTKNSMELDLYGFVHQWEKVFGMLSNSECVSVVEAGQ